MWEVSTGAVSYVPVIMYHLSFTTPCVSPGQSPISSLPTSPHSTLSFSIFFPFLLALFIFLLFHPFPFYQNSPTLFPGRMS